MFRYLVHVVLLAVAFKLTTSMIVGGKSTKIKVYPYMANLLVNGTHLCGGSIISDRWIVTAAHCIVDTSNKYTVRLGSTFKDFGGTVYSIDTIIRHENYRKNNFTMPYEDITVIKVSTPIIFDKTRQPVPLFDANEKAEVGVDAVVIGLGFLSENATANSPTLQTVTVPIVSRAECNASLVEFGEVLDGQICAGYPEGGKDACNGDSGSALTIKGRLAGIVTWGHGCARPGLPGVYTEVASYRGWVQQNTGV